MASKTKRINPTLDEGLDGDEWERILADFRGHVYHAGDWKKLAETSGLSYATIENIAYGHTRSPHMRTVIKLMDALGRGDEIRAALATNAPLTEDEAIKLRPANIKKRYRKIAQRAAKEKRERAEEAKKKKKS